MLVWKTLNFEILKMWEAGGAGEVCRDEISQENAAMRWLTHCADDCGCGKGYT